MRIYQGPFEIYINVVIFTMQMFLNLLISSCQKSSTDIVCHDIRYIRRGSSILETAVKWLYYT